MADKAEAIQFGDSLPLAEPANLAARLECSFRSNLKKNAIVGADTAMDYGRLAKLTEHYALEIAACTAPQALVPVLSTGGADYCVAILSCIRAHRPFVPVDAHWPRQRAREAIKRLNSPFIVATGDVSTVGICEDHTVLRIGCWDPPTDIDPIVIEAGVDYPPADSLVYGFFTSGTTGEPKCALNIHRGLVNRIDYMTQQFGSRRTTLLNSSHAFDSSLWQILWPIATGGTVAIPERSGPLDLTGTIESISRWRVEMTDFVPSIFEALVHAVECDLARKANQLRSLDAVIIGGEEANADVVRRFHDALPWIEVVNTYGPTEASIGSVFCRLPPQPADRIPLGKPIANTFAAVIASDNGIVPRGTTGQIAIGGACLGRGYLDDDLKTDAAFRTVRSPSSRTSYSVYLTGDLGRMDEAGTLWFHGRLDDQLKVGGIRIEPGEIEYHLNKHPAISSSKVIGVEGVGGRPRIAAFYSPCGSVTPEELQDYLLRSLPREWMPSVLKRVDQFPLNHNGKVDRRALSQLLAQDSPLSTSGFPSGREQSDNSMVDITIAAWRACFEDPTLTADADFLQLGGDSLAAVHIGLHLEEVLGWPVSPDEIFACRTPQVLARHLASPTAHGVDAADSGTDDTLIGDLDSFRCFPVCTPGQQKPVRHVVVTGATGYVGSHVLADLLSHGQFTVTCLVRAPDAAQAEARVLAALAATTTRVEPLDRALRVLPADLAQDRFALADDDWHHLLNETQAIVHMAAEVDFLKPYDALRQVNVGGLLQALALCTTGSRKRLLCVSSISVFGADVGMDVAIPESLVSRDWPRPDSGYDLSKWVCEAGLNPLFARGLPVKVFRLGEMMPPAQGLFNPRSRVTILLESCAAVGAYPVSDMAFDWTPVDYFARVLVSSIDDPQFAPQVVNFRSPVSVQFADLVQLSGLAERLEPLPLEAFLKRLRTTLKQQHDRPAIGRALSLLKGQQQEADRLATAARQCATTIAERQLDRLRLKWVTPSRASHAVSFNHIFQTPTPTTARARSALT